MKTLKNSGTATTAATTMPQRSTKSWDHAPPLKRRRCCPFFDSEMHLMLLIFVGCCAAMAASSAVIQDFGSVTAKGENIFMLATSNSNNDDDLGNVLPGELVGEAEAEDEEDDDTEGEGYASNGDATNDGKMPLMPSNARKEHHVAVEDIEMMQPPHNMRHQEHYKQQQQRIQPPQRQPLQTGLNDFKPQNEKELSSLNNRHLRYQQIQQALREPITPLPPQQLRSQHHHRHHEHRYQQEQQQPQHHNHFGKHEEYKWPLHHRSRHQHQHQHHHEHLHHHRRRHNFTSTATTSTTSTTTTTMRPRYFDRDGLYTNPLAWIPTTQGPLLQVDHKATKRHFNPHNHLFNDEDMTADMLDDDNRRSNVDEDKQEEFKRISLSLDANKDESTGTDKLFDSTSFDDDDDTDYSYEDDTAEDVKNTPPARVDNAKINVKRYTNPLRPPYKQSSASASAPSSLSSTRQHPSKNGYAASASNDDNYHEEDYANSDDDNKRVGSHSSEEPNDNDNDNFSDEKWNKIEHEHYRKQQQHQRAMQALRSRRPSPMDNTPNSITKTATNNNKFSPASRSATTLAKRQILNDDDTENIYSRYYVPGSLTRKKEEELGSPTAMLESRRKYALQQRQNKALASAHHRRIVKEGSCRLPQPRVERIHRDTWKIYTPHCTILHRCADDTGCCPTERQTCAPKRTKNVDLYFFVISLNETQGSIERLTFVNHTECHCVDKFKQRSAEYGSDESSSDIASNHIPYLRRATILNCNCPNLYEKILQEDGFCRCDCSSGNMGCDWLKRGMEHFSMNDRKCITEGRCKLPTCEYGAYMKKLGRCPRREERQLSVDTVDW